MIKPLYKPILRSKPEHPVEPSKTIKPATPLMFEHTRITSMSNHGYYDDVEESEKSSRCFEKHNGKNGPHDDPKIDLSKVCKQYKDLKASDLYVVASLHEDYVVLEVFSKKECKNPFYKKEYEHYKEEVIYYNDDLKNWKVEADQYRKDMKEYLKDKEDEIKKQMKELDDTLYPVC
jgi:hypothetical protein